MSNIRFAKKSDVNFIKEIIDEGISENYYSVDEINQYIDDDNKYLLVAASDDDKPLAAMFCLIGSLKEMCEVEHIPYPDPIFKYYNDTSIAVVYKTAATYISERCNGYVSQLFDEFDIIFDKIEHEIKIGLAIILPDSTMPIKKFVDKSGFVQKNVIIAPWNHIKSYCNYCHSDYCQCNAMLYIKENLVEEKI